MFFSQNLSINARRPHLSATMGHYFLILRLSAIMTVIQETNKISFVLVEENEPDRYPADRFYL